MSAGKAAHRRSLTAAVDDYTKAIDLLERETHGPVTTSMLAEKLGITPPSVSGMIRKLDDLGYLDYLPHHGFRLSTRGRQHALSIVRRHRLIELLLSELLGMSWDKVHDEAERLEHAISPELCELIAERLGHPSFDPHGDPIPDRDGRFPEQALSRLAELPDGTTARLRRVSDRNPEVLRSLSAGGFGLGAVFERVGARNDDVIVRFRGEEVTLRAEVVDALLVEVERIKSRQTPA